MSADEQSREEALRVSAAAAPPTSARGWQLRPVGDNAELEEGWNEPFPPKREWVVFHFYVNKRSLCQDYAYTTDLPPKPHFQVSDERAPHYRNLHPDWECKACSVLLMGRVIPAAYVGETRVVNVLSREPYQIYVGKELRRYKLAASKWADPDKHARRKDASTALRGYTDYVLTTPELAGALCELKGKVIACCCKSKEHDALCYGEALAELSAGA